MDINTVINKDDILIPLSGYFQGVPIIVTEVEDLENGSISGKTFIGDAVLYYRNEVRFATDEEKRSYQF